MGYNSYMRSIERPFDPKNEASAPGRPSVTTLSFAIASTAPARPLRRRPRLTRRGRLVIVLAVLAALFTVFSLGRVSTTAATSRGSVAHLRHVVVQPGDTLWAIARDASPGADPRATVDRIVTLNGLDGATVAPGQRLLLPTG